jgi:hypothetical protein
MSFTSNQHTVD